MCASSVSPKTSTPHLRTKTTPASQSLAPIHPSLPINIIPTNTNTQPAPPQRKTASPASSKSPLKEAPLEENEPLSCCLVHLSPS